MSHSCRLSRKSWKRDYLLAQASAHASIIRDAAPCEGSGRPRAAGEEIAKLAYSYWEGRGGHGGSALEDWVRAERELTDTREHRR
jgi:hypothetical protein